ncbi:MAG: hypothetical protein J3Q66DRAFT_407254 [Benniella sp.]|nr:MAG: hypothetical protein J3Q66DRAFT_407254 [Benniella sp.]
MAICSYKAQEGSINLVPVYNWIKRCRAYLSVPLTTGQSGYTTVAPLRTIALAYGTCQNVRRSGHRKYLHQREEPRASRKVAKVDGVHTKHAIPPSNYHQSLTTLLDSKNFQRVPRQGFKNVLDFAKVRDKVVLRSLGEGPTHSGGAFQLKTIIVTERMESLWKEFSSGSIDILTTADLQGWFLLNHRRSVC